MKKISAALMAILLAATLTACSSNNASSSSSSTESSFSSSTESSSSSSTESSSSSSTESSSSSSTESSSSSSTESSSSSSTESSSSSSTESKPVESKPEESKPEESKPESSISDPVTLLNSIYALFGDDERFPATGGDFSTDELIEGAGKFGLGEPEAIDNVVGYPAAEIAKIDSAASLMHMMNANTFTSGAYHVAAGTDAAALAEAIRANIQNRMWCCGFPDKLIVATVDDYVISAFGKEFALNAFTKHLAEAYPTSKILIDEPIL